MKLNQPGRQKPENSKYSWQPAKNANLYSDLLEAKNENLKKKKKKKKRGKGEDLHFCVSGTSLHELQMGQVGVRLQIYIYI